MQSLNSCMTVICFASASMKKQMLIVSVKRSKTKQKLLKNAFLLEHSYLSFIFITNKVLNASRSLNC